ncbi:MAG: hypothetical protein R2719_08900 [Micropruina sp.]
MVAGGLATFGVAPAEAVGRPAGRALVLTGPSWRRRQRFSMRSMKARCSECGDFSDGLLSATSPTCRHEVTAITHETSMMMNPTMLSAGLNSMPPTRQPMPIRSRRPTRPGDDGAVARWFPQGTGQFGILSRQSGFHLFR